MDVQYKSNSKRQKTRESTAILITAPQQQANPFLNPPNHSPGLPMPILQAASPQELVYAITTSNKPLYTKQELLTIIGRLEQFKGQFQGPCSYIS